MQSWAEQQDVLQVLVAVQRKILCVNFVAESGAAEMLEHAELPKELSFAPIE